MANLQIKLDHDNYSTPVSFTDKGREYHFKKRDILSALFLQHPNQKVFHGNQAYPVTLQANTQPPREITINVTLNKDIVVRKRLDKTETIPSVIFKSVYQQDQGYSLDTVKPHIIFKPRNEIADKRFSVLPLGAARQKNATALGKGSFGEVYEIEATLALDEVKWFKTHKPRVMKIQDHTESSNPVTSAQIEAQQLQQMGHIASKPLTIDEGLDKSYHLQEKAEGISLRRLLDHIENYSVETRFAITLALIQSLKEQIHDRGLVHRDIKPENIYIKLPETAEQSTHVTYIDAGFAKNILVNTTVSGTPAYVAPEELSARNPYQANESADVFSLAMVISEVWGAKIINPLANLRELLNNEKLKNNPIELTRELYKEKIPKIHSLFDKLPLSLERKSQIQSILQGMRAPQAERFHLKQAYNLFNQSELDYKVEVGRLTAGKMKQVAIASQEAILARETFTFLARSKENIIEDVNAFIQQVANKSIQINADHREKFTELKNAYKSLILITEKYKAVHELGLQEETYTDQLSHAIEVTSKLYTELTETLKVNKSSAEQLLSALEKGLDKIADEPIALKEFTLTLGIEALQGLNNKQAIYAKAKQILSKADGNITQLSSMLDDLEEYYQLADKPKQVTAAIQRIYKQINQWLWKYTHAPFELDKLASLNERAESVLEKLSQNLETIKQEREQARHKAEKTERETKCEAEKSTKDLSLAENPIRKEQIDLEKNTLQKLKPYIEQLENYKHNPTATLLLNKFNECVSTIEAYLSSRDIIRAANNTKLTSNNPIVQEFIYCNTYYTGQTNALINELNTNPLLEQTGLREWSQIKELQEKLRGKTTDLDRSKQKVLAALDQYIKSTMQTGTKKQLSPKRIADIKEFIAIVENAKDSARFIEQIKQQIINIQTGIEEGSGPIAGLFSKLKQQNQHIKFTLFGKMLYRSQLQDLVTAAVETKPVLKK